MTHERVLSEWRKAFDALKLRGIACVNCGEREAEYLNESGDLCRPCAESAIEYGRMHVYEAYEE